MTALARRPLSVLVIPLVGLAGVAPAQPFVWTNPAGGNFSVGGNWSPGLPPSAPATVLQFPSFTTQTTGNYDVTNDLGAFDLNRLEFTALGSPTIDGGNNLTVMTNATNPLRFNANGTTQPSVLNNGTSITNLFSSSGTGFTVHNGAALTFGGDGNGNIVVDAVIGQSGTGSGSVRIFSTAPSALGGGQLVTLARANTYAGGTTIQAGNVAVANSAAFGTGPVTVNSALNTLRVVAPDLNLANDFVLNAPLTVTGAIPGTTVPGSIVGSAVFLSGNWSGPGHFFVRNTTGLANYIFTGNAAFTGQAAIASPGIASGRITLAGNGTMRSADNYFVGQLGDFLIDNTGGTGLPSFNVNNRLNSAAAMTLASGNLIIGGSASAPTSEALASVVAAGAGVITIVPSATQSVTLTLGSISRPSGRDTLILQAANLGGPAPGASIVIVNANPGGAVGGGGALGTPTVNIFPYMISTGSPAAPAPGFVRFAGSGPALVPLAANEYLSNLYTAGAANPQANFRRSGTTPNSGGVAGLVTPTAVNALLLDTNTAAAVQVGVSVVGPATLTVSGGALAITNSGGTLQPGIMSQVSLGGLNFGTATGYVHTTLNAAINAPISGSGGLVKSGNGELFLTAANTFTGGVFINGHAALTGFPFGGIAYFADNQLGSAANAIRLDGGTTSRLSFQVPALFADANVTSLTINRPIEVGPSGGTLTNNLANGSIDVIGQISGGGPFARTGSGLVRFLTSNLNHVGEFVIGGGTAVQSDAVFGPPQNGVLLSGGFLQPLTSFTSGRSFLVTGLGAAVVTGAGVTWTLDGLLASQPDPSVGPQRSNQTFTKSGPGTLVMTANNPFHGQTNSVTAASVSVGDFDPTPRMSNPQTAETGGTLVLRGSNGALAVAGGNATNDTFVVNPGATLHLDNTIAVNNNRIGSVPVGLRGGTLALTGNAGASVNEFIGINGIRGLDAAGFAGTVTLTQPPNPSAVHTTTLTATSYNVTGSAMTFFRGTNLGAASGTRSAVVVSTLPALTQVNGLVPSAVLATTDNGTPTDFAAFVPSGTQQALVPFTAYAGQLPASGGSATATYDATADATLTGAVSANALRVSATSVNLAGNALTLSAGAILSTGLSTTVSGGSVASPNGPLRITVTGNLFLGTVGSPTAVVASSGFNKFGPGTLSLVGTPATTLTGSTGNVQVSQGTLALGNANAVGLITDGTVPNVGPTIAVNAGATLDLGALTLFRSLGVFGYGTVALGGATLETRGVAGASSVLVGLSGTASSALVLGFSGATAANNESLTVAGNNGGFSGAVRVLDGTLVAATPNALGVGTSAIQLGDTAGSRRAQLAIGANLTTFARAINVPAGSTPTTPHTLNGLSSGNVSVASNIALGQQLQLNLAGAVNGGVHYFTGLISGTGSLRQNTGNASYSLQNSYTGGFIADAGANAVIGVGASSFGATGPLGGGTVQFTTRGGALRADAGLQSLANNIVTTGATTNFAVVGANDLFLQGTLDFSSLTSPFALNVASRGVTTFGGGFGGTITSTSTQPLVKNGPGVVRFAATAGSTYQGGTVVNAGTLFVQNTTGSGTGPGPVTVNDGAILTGPGPIGGVTTVNAGGIIRPAFDTITSSGFIFRPNGGLTMANGAILATPVSSAPSQSGRVLTSGQINLAAATTLNVYLENNGVSPGTPVSFTLLQSASLPIAFAGGVFNPTNFAVTANFPLAAVSVTSPNPQTVVVNFTPVPEPAHMLAVAALVFGGVRAWRRREVSRPPVA